MYRFRKSAFGIITLIIFLAAGKALASRTPDVHFVPTPQDMVMEMLQVAGVGPNDVVYDLGCGDGRFVITAVRHFGARRGVGIDIDPVRVRESRENARLAGVSDRVTIVEGDLFEFDFREASVVTLYLLPSLNLKLRPKLFQQLKPGSRIVSYSFDMDDWKADATGRVGSGRYYFWVLPADIAGTWNLHMTVPGQNRQYTLEFTQKYQEVNGRTLSPGQPLSLIDPKLRGERLSFSLRDEMGGVMANMHFEGTVSGNVVRGEVIVEGGSFAGRYPWSAMRKAN